MEDKSNNCICKTLLKNSFCSVIQSKLSELILNFINKKGYSPTNISFFFKNLTKYLFLIIIRYKTEITFSVMIFIILSMIVSLFLLLKFLKARTSKKIKESMKNISNSEINNNNNDNNDNDNNNNNNNNNNDNNDNDFV